LALLPWKPEWLLLDRKTRKCFVLPEGLFEYDGAEEGLERGLKIRAKC